MELETLEVANILQKRLTHLKMSKQSLDFFTNGRNNIDLKMYTGYCSDAFVVPEEYGRRIVDLLYELLDEETKRLEQQFKEL